MEFRYRAVDKDRPSTTTDTASSQPPNPTLSLFPTRPMLGCNIGKSEDHVREAIQREIEKEQIRQEIIAVETSRRRELIAEVLQEMAVEKEMAIRKVAEMKGMSLEEKQTMCNNNLFGQMCTGPYSLVTSPMMQQMPETIGATAPTPELEPKKDKLIMLERADPVGAKRKAEDTQNSDERAKKCIAGGVGLAREEWSFTVLKEHLHQEKLHKEKEAGAALKANPISVRNNTTVKTGEIVSWCDVCKVGTNSLKVMRDHELGKKHIAAVNKQNEQPDTSSTSIITTPASVSSPSSEIITVLQNANVEAAIETGKKTVGEKKMKRKKKKKMVIIRCETCNIRTCSEKAMETHKLGKKHKALLEKEKQEPLAVVDTNVMTVPVRSLDADPEEK